MSLTLVGYTGFVGLNLQQHYKFDNLYNSKNFIDAKNKSFDTIFFSALPATKWLVNKNPEKDLENINKITEILKTITVKKFILISTIDVYDEINGDFDEDYDNTGLTNAYGKHRLMFENFVKSTFNNYNIIRLPALIGKQLKKNVLYDLINNNCIQNIPVNSNFQWYDLDWLKNDVDIILKNDIKICNLFTEPLNTLQIIDLFDNYTLEMFPNKNVINYDIKTKYGYLFNNITKNYIHSSQTVIDSIKNYIKWCKINKSQLCVSNICVKHVSQLQFVCLLKLFGITHIQIAPTILINSWSNLNFIDNYVEQYKNLDIIPYSFQSITFSLNNLNIFSDETSNLLLEQLYKIIDCAKKNNIKILVFGCPKNRTIINDLNNNVEIFSLFFNKVGNYIGDNDITICIEPNSKKYGCNFINTIDFCESIVRKINHPKIKMMVDIGNAIMENDNLNNIDNCFDILCNVDIANENMDCLLETNETHLNFSNYLKTNNYSKMINLEMLINRNCEKDENNELNDLVLSLNNFINIYGKSQK